MDVNILLSSLSMDLYRVAQAANRGSVKTCQRFLAETERWMSLLDKAQLQPSTINILDKTCQLKSFSIDQVLADHALVYSILLKNRVIQNSKELV
jgi:hypothetical protein